MNRFAILIYVLVSTFAIQILQLRGRISMEMIVTNSLMLAFAALIFSIANGSESENLANTKWVVPSTEPSAQSDSTFNNDVIVTPPSGAADPNHVSTVAQGVARPAVKLNFDVAQVQAQNAQKLIDEQNLVKRLLTQPMALRYTLIDQQYWDRPPKEGMDASGGCSVLPVSLNSIENMRVDDYSLNFVHGLQYDPNYKSPGIKP